MKCYHSGAEWNWKQWQWRGDPRSPNFLHLFRVISRTLWENLTPLQRYSLCILQLQQAVSFDQLDPNWYYHFIIIIIIILSCHQHGYPWPSLATPPYRSSLLIGPYGYIPYPHRTALCSFEKVTLLSLGHVRGSIGEPHLWAHPCFSSCVLHVWFV